MVGRYFLNILIGLDQWVNTWFAGYPDETISSRAGKMAMRGKDWLAKLIDSLFGRGHCKDSIEYDEGEDV